MIMFHNPRMGYITLQLEAFSSVTSDAVAVISDDFVATQYYFNFLNGVHTAVFFFLLCTSLTS